MTNIPPGDAAEKFPRHVLTPEDIEKGRLKGLETRRKRKAFADMLDELDFDVPGEAVALYRDPNCPFKVKADLLGKFMAQVYIKPKDQLASDTQRDILTDMMAFVSQGGRPLPPSVQSDIVAVIPSNAPTALVEDKPDDPQP